MAMASPRDYLLVNLTRRTVLGSSGVALAFLLAGCAGRAPRADGGGSGDGGSSGGDGSDGGLPNGSDGDSGSDAGGTRPEGTGGPGVTLVSVDDAPDLPVEPSVEITRDAATEDHPPQFRTTLTNTTDAAVSVGEGRSVHFEYVGDEDDQLILLPSEGEWDADPGCWRLSGPVAITQEYRMIEIAPDEPSTRLVDLYGAPIEEDACLPVGEYRFETTISVLSDSDEQEQSARWGFTILLE